jgi:hypothetical protein
MSRPTGHSHRAERVQLLAEGGVQRPERFLSAVQHRVEVMSLGYRSMEDGTILDGVSLEDQDVFEIVGQDSCGDQARDAAADDNGPVAKAPHAGGRPLFARDEACAISAAA